MRVMRYMTPVRFDDMMTHCEQRQLRNRDNALNKHFLYQCHRSFVTVPPIRRQEAVLSLFIFMGEANMITDYNEFFRPFVTKYILDPFLVIHISC